MFSFFSRTQGTEEAKPVKAAADKAQTTSSPPLQPFNLPSLAKLRDKHVVLASASPRRLEILAQVGLHPQVVPSTFAETLSKDDYLHNPHAYPINTATEKGKEVYERLVVGDTAGLMYPLTRTSWKMTKTRLIW